MTQNPRALCLSTKKHLLVSTEIVVYTCDFTKSITQRLSLFVDRPHKTSLLHRPFTKAKGSISYQYSINVILNEQFFFMFSVSLDRIYLEMVIHFSIFYVLRLISFHCHNTNRNWLQPKIPHSQNKNCVVQKWHQEQSVRKGQNVRETFSCSSTIEMP